MTQKQHDSDDDTPILEWIAGAIGFALFSAAIALTAANSFHAPKPPEIAIQPDAAMPVTGGYRVEFDVTNVGDQTAAQVVVRADLRSGSGIVESHDVTLDFLAPHSTVRAGVFLARDPQTLDLKIRPSSYQHP